MFKHFDLVLPTPKFNDSIVSMIIQLEKLRGNQIYIGINHKLFLQLKEIFHMVESLYSARIEGNRTTISDYVQDRIEGRREAQTYKEIENIEETMRYIDRCFIDNPNLEISEAFIKELHIFMTKDLDPLKEGSINPGAYRLNNVEIRNADYTPPMNIKVQEYMRELVSFVNISTDLQNELLKVAIAHHRFVWVHPFDNGNGRMSRILTYAMLKKAGFDKISFLNPAAVFCINREQYFENLAKADTGESDKLLDWCRYVLSGLLSELTKLRNLLDKDFLKRTIIEPAINYAVVNKMIAEEEGEVLLVALNSKDNTIMSRDIATVLKGKTSRQITYIIGKMLDAELLQKDAENGRKYLINLMNKDLLRGVVESLAKAGFTSQL